MQWLSSAGSVTNGNTYSCLPGPNGADPDTDGDGASNVLEAFVGTNPTQACALTTTRNDEAVGASPWDIDNSRVVNGQDMLKFAYRFGVLPPVRCI
jgi:hypothetical protein